MTWRRLAAGFLASCYGGEFGERLGPTQLGVGVSRGVEIFAATVRLALESNPRWVVVKVDFRNAFNEVSRVALLRFCAAHFPHVARESRHKHVVLSGPGPLRSAWSGPGSAGSRLAPGHPRSGAGNLARSAMI